MYCSTPSPFGVGSPVFKCPNTPKFRSCICVTLEFRSRFDATTCFDGFIMSTGEHFPEFPRLRELTKIRLIARIVKNHEETLRDALSSIKYVERPGDYESQIEHPTLASFVCLLCRDSDLLSKKEYRRITSEIRSSLNSGVTEMLRDLNRQIGKRCCLR